MKKYLLFIICLPFSVYLNAQNGNLLIIGGGLENISSTTSWNYEAFNWAVSQSENKKVALLHYATTTSSDFENYFKIHCAALDVKSFIVNASDANNETLMNEISNYDVFYFRGGDQYYYYTDWKGTLMEDLIHQKYNDGGVLCGTSAGLAILSGVMYNAQNNTAYSDVTIKNYNDISITLKNDFLQLMPGFIFDSHFTERGRMGRLVSFMANWKVNHGENVIGIGVDERSALAINADGTATAYGAGTINIFRLREETTFGSGPEVSVDSLEYAKLIHGKSIDLNSLSVTGYGSSISSEDIIHDSPHKIYASGIEKLGYANVDLLKDLLNDGNTSDPIIIFTGSDLTNANNFKDKLIDLGAEQVTVYRADYTTHHDDVLAHEISAVSKFIFVGNNAYDFMSSFMNTSGVARDSLMSAFNHRKLVLAFIGDNARFCGANIIGNYLGSDANSTISEGLNLIKNTIIIPRTYERGDDVTDLWHASNACIPYTMVKERLKHGIWLNVENYIVYEGDGDKVKIKIKGSSPAIILTQNSAKGELVSQTYSGTGAPDKKGGFDKMYLSFLKNQEEYILGNYESTITSVWDMPKKTFIKVYPNPVLTDLSVNSEKDIQYVCLYDILGNLKFRENYIGNTASIDIEKLNLQQGVYMLEVMNWEDERFIQKIIIK